MNKTSANKHWLESKWAPWLFAVAIVAIVILITVATNKPYSGGTSSGGSKNNSYFTNKYGTPTTKCNHSGCTKNIASSGDTNCCPVHSKKCLNCGCYIDEDAMYCMDCIKSYFD